MRTNIVIDDLLMAKAMKVSGLGTKKDVVELALKTLIKLKDQSSVRELRGKFEWLEDLDAQRTDDPR